MPIDSNIYFQSKTPDFFGSFQNGMEKGLSMKKLIDQDTKEKGIQDAFKSGLVQNPDGSYKQDTNITMKGLLDAGAGQEAMAFQKQQQQMQLEQQKAQKEKMLADLDLTARLTGSVTDQNSYTQALREAQKYGLDVSQFPQQYDPNLVKRYQGMALTAKEQIERDLNERKFAADQADKKTQREIEREKLKNELNKKSGETSSNLRKERSGLPTTRATQEISAAYNKIQTSALDPSAAGDLSLVFGYMKMLDPGSTVREGEFATAQNAAGVPTRISNYYNKIMSGERLSPEQRADFLKQAKGLYDSQLAIQDQVDSQFIDMAKAEGIDPKNVILNFGAKSIQKEQNKTPVQNKTFKTSEIEWK